jgi:hypothetical protein
MYSGAGSATGLAEEGGGEAPAAALVLESVEAVLAGVIDGSQRNWSRLTARIHGVDKRARA